MASPTPTKRTRTQSSAQEEDYGHLESWFNGEAQQMQEYIHTFSRKNLIVPKFLSMAWLKEEQLEEIRVIINHQKLKKFLELSGCIYPDLVKVFYTNLTIDGENMNSHVKGVDIEITPKVWFAVAGLRYEGQQIEKRVLDDFNKTVFYKACMRYPGEDVKSFGVGKLAMTPRILNLLIVWMLTPRGNNHATLTEDDLMLLYCLINKVKVNWVHTMMEHMMKEKKLNDYKLPYAILISRMLEFFEA